MQKFYVFAVFWFQSLPLKRRIRGYRGSTYIRSLYSVKSPITVLTETKTEGKKKKKKVYSWYKKTGNIVPAKFSWSIKDQSKVLGIYSFVKLQKPVQCKQHVLTSASSITLINFIIFFIHLTYSPLLTSSQPVGVGIRVGPGMGPWGQFTFYSCLPLVH